MKFLVVYTIDLSPYWFNAREYFHEDIEVRCMTSTCEALMLGDSLNDYDLIAVGSAFVEDLQGTDFIKSIRAKDYKGKIMGLSSSPHKEKEFRHAGAVAFFNSVVLPIDLAQYIATMGLNLTLKPIANQPKPKPKPKKWWQRLPWTKAT